MKYLILLSFLFSLNALACQNSIPESEVRKAIALEPNAGAKTCKDLPEEKCICYDGKDWQTVDLIDGELIENPDKAFARELRERNERDAQKTKEDKCKNLSFKGNTIAQLRQELNESMECRR